MKSLLLGAKLALPVDNFAEYGRNDLGELLESLNVEVPSSMWSVIIFVRAILAVPCPSPQPSASGLPE